jgi:hypothetical protein
LRARRAIFFIFFSIGFSIEYSGVKALCFPMAFCMKANETGDILAPWM